ncbi:MAG TPA: hypothetical protein VHE34_06530 [Puia sp.]|uniref:hypothetical protein n=1 Tax=Puia sp. TaxID=2045100 RepID=UPI002CAB20AC|nr:hypothetical protein [Puia sp.]HVU94861.1 hypothetical protein [Puia sp.]
MKRILPFANLMALIATIAINYLSNSGLLQTETIAAVSARYPTLITPAPYAFAIWGLIYIGLACFVVYQLKRKPETEIIVGQVGWWFVLSCIANCCWVLAWIHGWTGLSVLLMLVLLSSLLRIMVSTDMEMPDASLKTIAFVWWPFCLYIGWITMAIAVNIAAWLVSAGWGGWGIGPEAWAMLVSVIAGGIYLLLTWRRNMREAALAGTWALIAVGIADRAKAPEVSTIAYLVAGVLFISTLVHAFRNRDTSPFRKRHG